MAQRCEALVAGRTVVQHVFQSVSFVTLPKPNSMIRSTASTVLLLSISLLNMTTFAQSDPLWLRGPAISPDGKAIVFTYKGDLWRVPRTRARAA